MSIFGNSKWFLKNKKEKRKANGGRSDDSKSSDDSKERDSIDLKDNDDDRLNNSGSDNGGDGGGGGSNGISAATSNGNTFIGPDGVRVDEEGYIIRNDIPSGKNDDDDRFYSSSDEDSEDEKTEKRFKFEIKPVQLTNGGPSVAELRQTVKGLSISPSLQQGRSRNIIGNYYSTPEEGGLKRSTSQSLVKSSEKEFSNGLSSSISNISTPSSIHGSKNKSSNHCESLLETPSSSNFNSTGDRYAALSAIFDGSGDIGFGLSGDSSNTSNNNNSIGSNGLTSSINGLVGDKSGPIHKVNGSLNTSLTTSTTTSLTGSQIYQKLNHSESNGKQALNSTVINNGVIGASSLSKSISSNSIMGPPPPMSIPRPPTKRGQMSPSLSHPNNITRCKSYGSLSSDLRMTPVSVNSSRGPSPLTLGMTNVIPIAVAIQECISARFKGSDESKCQIQIIGSLKIAFPSGIIQVFANNTCPALLSFKLMNSSRFERLIPNKDIVMQNKSVENGIKLDTYSFDMNMVGLTNHLKKLCEQAPNSRYFNAEILKYQLKARGATFCPLQVVSHWKCEPQTTGLKIDYKYNACALSSISPLRNVTFSVNVDGGVKSTKTTPNAAWNEEKKEISWKFDEISMESEGKGLGSLKAKFDVSDGPSTPGPVNVHFNGNAATFSGVEFQLNCIGYRISLMKKQISTGRYLSEADSSISYACI